MERVAPARKAQAFRILAKVNDHAHSMVFAFLVFGHLIIGFWWHLLFIFVVVRLQLAFRGCPMTIFSNFLRRQADGGEHDELFGLGATEKLYDRIGNWACPVIFVTWVLVSLTVELALGLWN